MLVCPIAATAPKNIDSTETKTTICRHSWMTPGNACSITRTNSAIAAAFGAMEKKAVIGVGEPS